MKHVKIMNVVVLINLSLICLFMQPLAASEKQPLLVAEKPITWATGSDGRYIFLMLPETNYCLVPTGELLRLGLAPICGELDNGASLFGVNQHHLSGAPAECFDTAVTYAKGINYHGETFSGVNASNLQDELLRELFVHLIPMASGGEMPSSYEWKWCPPSLGLLDKITLHAQRLGQLFPQVFFNRQAEIVSALDKLQPQLENYETYFSLWQQIMRKYVPCVYCVGSSLDEAVNTLKLRIEQIKSGKFRWQISEDRWKELCDAKPFPVVFASTHQLEKRFHVTKGYQEIALKTKKLEIGSEIDVIYTDTTENLNRLRDSLGDKASIVELRLFPESL